MGWESEHKFSKFEIMRYMLENFVAADPNAMFKVLIVITLAFIIGFGTVWAILDNMGMETGDWPIHGMQDKVWFAFQMLATQGYDVRSCSVPLRGDQSPSPTSDQPATRKILGAALTMAILLFSTSSSSPRCSSLAS